ncbi:MAG: hypothetical protein Kow0069_34910 [Promethearchaeota archaeon]
MAASTKKRRFGLILACFFAVATIASWQVPRFGELTEEDATTGKLEQTTGTRGNPSPGLSNPEYLEQAEALAVALAADAIPDSGGWKWAEEGYHWTSMEKGAAGIGSFFLDLYAETGNTTYLAWAENVYRWLVNPKVMWSAGNFSETDSLTAKVGYTGFFSGMAGIGDFMGKLYEATLNATYLNRAEEVCYFLNALRVDENGYSKYPWTDSANPTGILESRPDHARVSVGSNGSSQLSYLEDGGSTYDLDGAVYAPTIENPYDSLNHEVLSLGTTSNPDATAKEYVLQTFTTREFPIDLADNGLTVRLWRDIGVSSSYVRAYVYEWNGGPGGFLGNLVGGASNPIYGSDMGTAPGYETFTWPGGSEPIIDGNSTDGYALVLRAFDVNNELDTRELFLSLSNDAAFSDGSVYFSLTGQLNDQNDITDVDAYDDLVFTLASDPLNVTRTLFEVTLAQLGLVDYELLWRQDFYKSLTVEVDAKYDGALDAPHYTAMFVINRQGGYWERFTNDSITSTEGRFSWSTTTNVFKYLPPTPTPSSTLRFVLLSASTGDLNHKLNLDYLHFKLDFDDKVYAYNLHEGNAGIGKFFVNMYERTGNETYLDYASGIARFLNATRSQTGTPPYHEVAWEEAPLSGTYALISGKYNGYNYGVAGIADFLLDLAQYNSTSPEVQHLLKGIANTLLDNRDAPQVTSLVTGEEELGVRWAAQEGGSIFYAGYVQGAAGIGDVCLKLGDRLAESEQIFNPLVETAQLVGIYLSSNASGTQTTVLAKSGGNYGYSYRVYERAGSTRTLFHLGGAAGVVRFLNNAYRHTRDVNASKAMASILDWITSELNVSEAFTNSTEINRGFLGGLAGIGTVLLEVAATAKLYADLSFEVMDLFEGDPYVVSGGQYKPRVVLGKNYSYGLYHGSAGIGMSFIRHYRRSLDNTFLIKAQEIGNLLRQQSYWRLNNWDPRVYSGVEHGVAGIGLFLIELSRSTQNDSLAYATGAESIGIWLAANAQKEGVKWSWAEYYTGSTPSSLRYNGYAKGVAGIIDFYVELAWLTGNWTYMQYAEYGANYLLDVAYDLGYEYFWDESDLAFSLAYNGIDLGVAGIGKALLKLGLASGNNQTLIEAAKKAGTWLYYDYDAINDMWFISDQPSMGHALTYSVGTAGIVDFLLDLYEATHNSTFLVQAETAAQTLVSSPYVHETSNGTYWQLGSNQNYVYYGHANGSAGIIDGLLRLYRVTGDSNYLAKAVEGAQYLSSLYDGYFFPKGPNEPDELYTGLAWGTAGIADTLLDVPDLAPPQVTSVVVNVSLDEVEYYSAVQVSFLAADALSGLGEIAVKYWRDGSEWTAPVVSTGSGSYSATIPALPYQTQVEFLVVAVDGNGFFRLDHNGSTGFVYQVKDTVIPAHDEPVVWDSKGNVARPLTHGGSGWVYVNISEPAYASGLKNATLKYWTSPLGTGVVQEQLLDGDKDGTYAAEVFATNYAYGDTFNYVVELVDNAGNKAVLNRNFTVGDYEAPTPTLFQRKNNVPLVYSTESVGFLAFATDEEGGAGIDPDGGVFVAYTTNLGKDWKEAPLSFRTSTGYYEGSIPPHPAGSQVRYVLGVRDRAGNVVYWGRDPSGLQDRRFYDSLEDIPITGSFFYQTRFYWITTFIVIVAVAAAVIVIYVLYTRRGSYWAQMRRKAGSTATWVSIKERVVGFVYRIAEAFEKLGDKLIGSADQLGTRWDRVVDWYDEHFGPRVRAIVRGVLTAAALGILGYGFYYLYAFGDLTPTLWTTFWIGVVLFVVTLGKKTLKGAGRSVKGFFRGVGNFVMGIRGYHVAVWTVVAVLFIVGPVIKYIESPPYPLGIIWLINFGFVMFISGFVLFILKLIFKFFYK